MKKPINTIMKRYHNTTITKKNPITSRNKSMKIIITKTINKINAIKTATNIKTMNNGWNNQ